MSGKRLLKSYPLRSQPHAGGVARSDDAETVMFDLVYPARPYRRLFSQARQARIKTGLGLIGAQPMLKLTPY